MEACTGKGDQPLPDLADTHRSLFSGGCAQWCRSKPPAGYPQHPGWRWSRRAAARTAHETLWPRFCHTCLIRQLAENSPRSEIRKQVFSWGIKDNCLQQMHCLFVLLWVSCHAFFFLSLSLSRWNPTHSLLVTRWWLHKITCLQWEYSEITSNTVCDVQANQSMQKKLPSGAGAVSVLEKPHYCTVSCCYPTLRRGGGGVRTIPRGSRKGPPAELRTPRSMAFRYRAKIKSGVLVLRYNGKFDANYSRGSLW